ncbi:MAG: bifunctional glutamate N-acetyltransferase/amino-acid acetyltransferase ArgJ [Candidatus Omnitrophica bacterium]|nr:bifunctional glutamate N-acetyltransferase/amino-acid acetyltransferase ArgJ [Candidatus Omnitrophota bacterium]
MIIVKGGVTAAKGFLASGVRAGIKKSGRKDLALIYSEEPAVASGAFTTNRFQASPVKLSRVYLKNGKHQAIIVNSGNANCANGSSGDKNALYMAYLASCGLCLKRREVLVASTGIIGRPLPIEKIDDGIIDLVEGLSKEGGDDFAEAIMTTDTVKKESAVKIKLKNGCIVTIGGACKGVGMIYPVLNTERHATMLCFFTTDAAISKKMLARALEEAMDTSFNMISVDGDMSTNDSCFIMANGLAGNKKITSAGRDYAIFTDALKFLATELAKKMVADGEGATKFVEIEVTNAKSEREARVIARKVSTSNLLKCCVYGEDPNWGRVAASCGASGVEFDPDKVDIYLGPIKVLNNGASVRNFDKEKARKVFKKHDINIKVDLKSGRYKAKSWTSDLSKEYVAVNSEYST